MRFRTTIIQDGKTATGIRVPDEVIEALGAGKRPPVRVTINGATYRTTVAVMSGAFMISVSAENRAKTGVNGGDVVDVDVELDTEPRTVELPPELAAALDADPEARATYDRLSPSNQGWHVLQVTGTTNPETRQRRIERSIAALRAGKPR